MSSDSSSVVEFSIGATLSDTSSDTSTEEDGLTSQQVAHASKMTSNDPALVRTWHWVHRQQKRLTPAKYNEFVRLLREHTSKNSLFFNVAELFEYQSDLLQEFITYMR